MANVRNVTDFVEQLSNCIGEISGNEVVFKKIAYSSEYVVRMRNHNEKVANIWYDYDKDKIVVQLVPAFRNMEYSLDDLTIENIKDIGQIVRRNALNRIGESMEFKVAKKILNENGYILKDKLVDESTSILPSDIEKNTIYEEEYEIYNGKLNNFWWSFSESFGMSKTDYSGKARQFKVSAGIAGKPKTRKVLATKANFSNVYQLVADYLNKIKILDVN